MIEDDKVKAVRKAIRALDAKGCPESAEAVWDMLDDWQRLRKNDLVAKVNHRGASSGPTNSAQLNVLIGEENKF